MTTSIR
ncbi:hypothetical protein GQ600_11777 [Phytophthora cactorum]|jgi:hypothetical protein|nr:hypothetical protein GQ600_11777 [Phytophthora cactorum]